MGELRKDYFLDRYVLITDDRGKRPHEFLNEEVKEKKMTCPFCPGNENLTPPEIDRLKDNGNWKIRVFPNKYAIVLEKGKSNIMTENTFFTFASNFGKHEVIVETPDHKKKLSDLSEDHIREVFNIYIKRINALNEIAGVEYVLVFKNHGKEAGTSLVHSHSQVVAYNRIPKLIQEEIEGYKKFETCPFCQIISIERESYRAVFENNSFVSFTPYASRFPLELWIFPKRHVDSITKLSQFELKDLATILKRILFKLESQHIPYNFYLHNAPQGEDFHFHIEIVPRISLLAGFELGSGDYVNIISPESAANFYKE